MKPFAKFDPEIDSIIESSHKRVLNEGMKALSEHFKYINTGTRGGKILNVCNEICFNVSRYGYTRKNPYRVTILAHPNKPLDGAKQTRKQMQEILKHIGETSYVWRNVHKAVKIKIVRLPQMEGTVCDEFLFDFDL